MYPTRVGIGSNGTSLAALLTIKADVPDHSEPAVTVACDGRKALAAPGVSRHMRLLAAALMLALGLAGCARSQLAATAGDPPPAAGGPVPFSQLDDMLAAHDWNRLAAATSQPLQAMAFARRLDWFKAKVMDGAGFFVASLYARQLMVAGAAISATDTDNDLRMTAGAMILYAVDLIGIDGARCADATAPGNRMAMILHGSRPIVAFLKQQSPAAQQQAVDVAVALERRTAALRGNDELL